MSVYYYEPTYHWDRMFDHFFNGLNNNPAHRRLRLRPYAMPRLPRR